MPLRTQELRVCISGSNALLHLSFPTDFTHIQFLFGLEGIKVVNIATFTRKTVPLRCVVGLWFAVSPGGLGFNSFEYLVSDSEVGMHSMTDS